MKWINNRWDELVEFYADVWPFATLLFITMLLVLVVVAGVEQYDNDEAEAPAPLTLPGRKFQCPEDADTVIRYGTEPAGMWVFCVASDDIESIID